MSVSKICKIMLECYKDILINDQMFTTFLSMDIYAKLTVLT